MTLVDTSVWVDHIREPIPQLNSLINGELARIHPMIIGEIAMGSMKYRAIKLATLQELDLVTSARHDEVLRFVEMKQLFATGLSFIDAHLLASVMITPDCRFWTRDKRLKEAAIRLEVASPLV